MHSVSKSPGTDRAPLDSTDDPTPLDHSDEHRLPWDDDTQPIAVPTPTARRGAPPAVRGRMVLWRDLSWILSSD